MFEAVIFDWDGTLADTVPVVLCSFQEVLRRFGCEVSDDFLAKRIGIGARNMFKDALISTGMPFDESTLDRLMDEKIQIHVKLSNEISLLDGAIELLFALHRKVRIALATMSNRIVIDKLLLEKNVKGYFDLVITADDVIKPKPEPEIFLKCSNKLAIAPEKCVVIEDSLFGVMAARKAGMKCIVVSTGAYSTEELEIQQPDLIVESLTEKQRILKFVFTNTKSRS